MDLGPSDETAAQLGGFSCQGFEAQGFGLGRGVAAEL
jgi:hypothetical protein